MTAPTRPHLVSLDHVQLAMPAGGENKARGFYCLMLGLSEMEKPADLAKRGGCWFANGAITVHLGVEEGFCPAKKAHPAFRVLAIDTLAGDLHSAGHPVTWDKTIPSVRRFFTADPFGNRIEFIAEPEAAP